MKSIILVTILTIAMTSACNDQTAEQAQTTYRANAELIQEIELKMDTLVQMRNRINVQGRALTEEEVRLVERIDRIEQRWQGMKDNLPVIDGLPASQKAQYKALREQEAYQKALLLLKADANAVMAPPVEE